MTNREWLNSLTNEELVEWLFKESSSHFNYQKGDYEIDYIHPTKYEISWNYTQSELGMKQWLEENHK